MADTPLTDSLYWNVPPDTAAKTHQKAMSFLADHALAPTPLNHTIAYLYSTGENQRIVAAIDTAIEQRHAIDTYFLKDLFAACFVVDRSQEIMNQQDGFKEMIISLMHDIGQGHKDTREYGQALQENIKNLAGQPTADDLVAITSTLVQATVAATRSVKKMADRLENTRQKVGTLREELGQARREARYDSLTGLINRAELWRYVKRLISDRHQPFSLLMCDIDHFKRVNDTYGHPVGDAVLKKVASVLRDMVPDKGVVARYGGEEFIAVLPGDTMAGAMDAAEAIRLKVADLKLVRKRTQEPLPQITISIGVAACADGDTMDDLFCLADDALYRAKREGRNLVRYARREQAEAS